MQDYDNFTKVLEAVDSIPDARLVYLWVGPTSYRMGVSGFSAEDGPYDKAAKLAGMIRQAGMPASVVYVMLGEKGLVAMTHAHRAIPEGVSVAVLLPSEFQRLYCRRKIGQMIAQRREKLNMSQYQLSRLINGNYKHIDEIEKGIRSVGVDTLDKICAAIGLEINIQDKKSGIIA